MNTGYYFYKNGTRRGFLALGNNGKTIEEKNWTTQD
jgi:hypothetical protein